MVPATAIEGFPSPAIAPTVAAEEGLFPPPSSALLSPETGLSGGDKEHAGAFFWV